MFLSLLNLGGCLLEFQALNKLIYFFFNVYEYVTSKDK